MRKNNDEIRAIAAHLESCRRRRRRPPECQPPTPFLFQLMSQSKLRHGPAHGGNAVPNGQQFSFDSCTLLPLHCK